MKNGIFPIAGKQPVKLQYLSMGKGASNNYRQILVLSIFSRIIERIVQDQLHEFRKANCILTNNQHAFRALYSTNISLVNIIEHWRQNVDNQTLNIMIFLDLKKHLIPLIKKY